MAKTTGGNEGNIGEACEYSDEACHSAHHKVGMHNVHGQKDGHMRPMKGQTGMGHEPSGRMGSMGPVASVAASGHTSAPGNRTKRPAGA